VTIATTATDGDIIPIGLALTSGAQMVNGTVSLPVGTTSEGFETGIPVAWTNTSPIPWIVDNTAANAHSGNSSAKSGTITHSGSTDLSISLNIGLAGNITFWRKVSSEAGYDFLKFYIDSTELGSWSGNQPWAIQTYPVTTGQHVFKWTYLKDASVSSGFDCAWIDDIVFPLSGNSSLPIMYQPITELNFNDIELNTPVAQFIVVRNLGTAALTGTFAVPELVHLVFNGLAVGDNYNYSIPAGGNGLFGIGLNLTEAVTFDGDITITSNDNGNPIQVVGLHITTTANGDNNGVPLVTQLEGNYPNPFNPVTTLRFALKEQGPVTLSVYNLKGQLVRSLVAEDMKAGNHSITWNGMDNSGKAVSSGVYLYRMQAPGYTQTRKMMLMK
jgi:hypothetical protein